MTLLSTVLYPALLVAAGAVGYNLVDDSSAPQGNVPPRVEVKKSVDEKIEVTVNGQRINVKPGQPLEIKIKSGGDERVIRLPLSGSGEFHMLAPHGHDRLKFDFDDKEFAKLGDSFKELRLKFDSEKDLAKLSEKMHGFKLELQQKDLAKLHEEMKGFKLEFDEKEMAKLGEKMKGFKMELQEKDLAKLGKELEGLKFKFNDKELKELQKIEGKELKLKSKVLKGRDLTTTLTPDQRKKMKSQGYLVPNDLTPAQREMLPQGKGEWQISISIDGESYNFRSK